ncbi:unnamed protein product [Ophioblennius macclurei]
MPKVFTQVDGNCLGCEEKFLKKLKRKGVKVAKSEEESDATILFCAIVSRFETDISAALSRIPSGSNKPLIVVAMHHTFNENYPLPERDTLTNHAEVSLIVDLLFFENKGLLKCPRNKKAKKAVCDKLKKKGQSAKEKVKP